MARVGYARVSSVGQSLRVQKSKLKDCDKVYTEKRSGLDTGRPQLKACLDYIREGDTLVVTRLDRLARSTLDLYRIHEDLKTKGVQFEVIDQKVSTADATGRLLFGMLALIAQFETELRAERQADGIAKAKERGVQFGRAPKMSDGQIKELKHRRAEGVLIKTLMADYGLSKASIYRYLGSH